MDYNTDTSTYERTYVARRERYDVLDYRNFGSSGVQVSPITLGTWQNFGDLDPRENVRALYLTAFDNGINSFDFGNNYGRPGGSSESLFGSFLASELKPYRDELIITTKAGYDMWPGPNGRGSSAKHLISSLDQSLKRMGLDYVDIFYSHRYDPDTPIEETAEALDSIRRSGRALYVGISSYGQQETARMHEELVHRGTKMIVHQSQYAIFNRWPEHQVLDFCKREGVGFAAFSPLAQGLLSDKYLSGARETGRAGEANSSVWVSDWDQAIQALQGLKEIAAERDQSLVQMALSWVLRRPEVCTAVIGARTPEQIKENLVLNDHFTADEESRIETLSQGIDVDLWKESRRAE